MLVDSVRCLFWRGSSLNDMESSPQLNAERNHFFCAENNLSFHQKFIKAYLEWHTWGKGIVVHRNFRQNLHRIDFVWNKIIWTSESFKFCNFCFGNFFHGTVVAAKFSNMADDMLTASYDSLTGRDFSLIIKADVFLLCSYSDRIGSTHTVARHLFWLFSQNDVWITAELLTAH